MIIGIDSFVFGAFDLFNGFSIQTMEATDVTSRYSRSRG